MWIAALSCLGECNPSRGAMQQRDASEHEVRVGAGLGSRHAGDLGAEVDERFEYSDAYENFEVFIDPEETLTDILSKLFDIYTIKY